MMYKGVIPDHPLFFFFQSLLWADGAGRAGPRILNKSIILKSDGAGQAAAHRLEL